jgi:hypothetical protein
VFARIIPVILFLLVSTPAFGQAAAFKRGDVVRVDSEKLQVIGLDSVTVVGIAGDHVMIKTGVFAVNGKPVQGLTFDFLADLPRTGVDRKLPRNYVAVVREGKGPDGPIRYWAVITAAMLRGARSVEQ